MGLQGDLDEAEIVAGNDRKLRRWLKRHIRRSYNNKLPEAARHRSQARVAATLHKLNFPEPKEKRLSRRKDPVLRHGVHRLWHRISR